MTTYSLTARSFARVMLLLLAWSPPLMAVEQSATVPAIPGKSNTAPVSQKAASGSVRLGIAIEKPGEALYAQLPALRSGCGFLLKSVQAGSPARDAGLKPMDVIVSLDDQLLINENQLMTLLSLYRPGERVKVSYFRSGVRQEAIIILEQRPAGPGIPDHETVSLPLQASPSGIALNVRQTDEQAEDAYPFPLRVVSYEERSASISDQFGTATLMLREGEPWLHVESPQGVETFNGPVSKTEELARVPVVWRSRLPVLQRSLEESVRLRHIPRMRYVPKQKQQFAENK